MNGSIKFPLQAFEQRWALQREDSLGLSRAATALKISGIKTKTGEEISVPCWIILLVASSRKEVGFLANATRKEGGK